jgi:alpha-L-fucosidase
MRIQRKPPSPAVWAAASALLTWALAAAEPPTPFGPAPSPRQLQWDDLEFCGFIHFTVNTFTSKEWGYGDESEDVFNPSDFDADQIARVAAEGGMKGLVLTCKHHDGFCLWPSAFTTHSVKNSKWRNGQGDVVRELSAACRRQGLKFGVYLSPWDRNQKTYGTPDYITYYRQQLRELLTQYGPISEVWFDGANGGDGFYGGARETRQIDRRTYYDWPATWKLVRALQPDACIFSDAGPDIRWVGNEDGVAGDPCWATLNGADFFPGSADAGRLNRGDRPGSSWLPAECDVSIRPGWFYHASEDDRVKTPQKLLALYYASVGRGASLLLNLPPDKRGQIPETDAHSLREFHRLLDATFAYDLARHGKATASNWRGADPRFAPANVNDGRPDTYWSTEDNVTVADITLTFDQPVAFNVVRLREFIALGQRIDTFALDTWQEGKWVEFAHGTGIGHCRLVRAPAQRTEKIRLRITGAACPAISEIGVFAEAPASTQKAQP